MFRILIAIACLVVAGAAAAQEPIRIGFLTVRTGPLAAGGKQMEQGIELFLKERNNTLAGRKVQLIMADTGGNPAGARTKTQELVEREKVHVIIGPLAATQLFSYFTIADKGQPGYFPGAPFIGAGITIVFSAIVFIYTAWRYDLMHRPSVAKKPHRPDMAPPGQQAIPPYEESEAVEPE